jgi:CopG family nickel-responsive transcriptional regulator
MNKIKRFGVSMEDNLLKQFDKLINRRGYTNRSEAVRDLVREKLVEESIHETKGEVFGALVFIYDHHKR